MRPPLALPAAVLASALALGLVGASAAVAAHTAINAPYGLYGVGEGFGSTQTVFSIDPATATTTVIGAPGPTSGIAFEAAHDFSTGQSYYVSSVSGAIPFILNTVDVTTGAVSVVGTLNEAGTQRRVFSITVTLDGDAYGIGDGGTVYAVNLANGVLTPVTSIGTPSFSFATDPTTGDLTAIDENGGVFQALAATPTVFIPAGTLTLPANTFPYGLEIDGDGEFWLATENNPVGNRLFRFTAATLATPTLVAPFSPDFTFALLITQLPVVPAGPQLANSGADNSGAIAGGVGAGILALAGVVLLVVRRRAV